MDKSSFMYKNSHIHTGPAHSFIHIHGYGKCHKHTHRNFLFMLADEHIQCYTLTHVIIIVLGKTLMAQWSHYVPGTVLSTFFNLHPMR